MASISTDSSGNRRILFVAGDGVRKTIRIGSCSKRDAESFKLRVEALHSAKLMGTSPDRDTSLWLASLSDDLHTKLSAAGLVEPREPANPCLTLDAWLTKYLDQRKSELKPGSLERLNATAKRMRTFFGKMTPLNELTPNGAADWRASMLAEGLSETTVRNRARDSKTIFNAAVDRELIGSSPFRKLKSGVVAANRDRYVTPDEAVAILSACPSLEWQALFGLARFAGLRTPSETHRLTWADVDWARKRLTVYAPKTDSTRIVPITTDLLTILQAAFDEAPPAPAFREWVKGTLQRDHDAFTAAERSQARTQYEVDVVHRIIKLGSHRSNLHRGLEKIIQRAGLSRWDDLYQTLRRSAETDFARTNPQHAVSKWIGHSMAVSEKHYLQVTDSLIDAATNAPGLIIQGGAESGAVGVRNVTQVQETRRNEGSADKRPVVAKECENPCKTGAFVSSKGGTRTRDPRLMKPVL